jgi:alanine dehydrogenase
LNGTDPKDIDRPIEVGYEPEEGLTLRCEEFPMNHETLLLSREDIQKCLDMPTCLKIVEQVFKAHGEADVVMPPKLSLTLEGADGWVNAMPAYVGPFDAAGLKWVGGWSANIERGLPFIMGTILLIDPQTGLLLSVMDGGFITDLRTGAATGVTAKYLAKKSSKVVGLVGAGAQARMQLRALCSMFSLEEVRVADIMPQALVRFAREMEQELGVTIKKARNNQEAVEGADIIVTATTSHQVLVRRAWVSGGAFVASIGSYPELDPELILNAEKVVVDSWAQNKHRGELSPLVHEGLFGEENMHGEIGEVVAGTIPGRENEDEVIVACLIGLGSHDVGCAHFAYKEAKKRGLGSTFDFQQLR